MAAARTTSAPVLADETFYKYGPDMTEDQETGFRDGTLEVYGVGILRP
ncbi:hypothetical protein ABZU45_40980 [Streptomyces avermitilis]